MNRKPRRWEAILEDDPGAGLMNLFDVWIAFSVALLLALFGYLQNAPARSPSECEDGAPIAAMETTLDAMAKAPRFRPSSASLTGNGTRLGIAYRLQSGEVVYVPENAPK